MTNYDYHVGGSLPPEDPSYVLRQADQDLYENLKKGMYCYVLNCRQMGKSSLRIRTMRKLQANGFLCAGIDLTEIGTEGVTQENWYPSIINNLISSLDLSKKIKLRTWWKEREELSLELRLSQFFAEILSIFSNKIIIIFIDEIDTVLRLNFPTHGFFSLIRHFYNQRAENPSYQRLIFALFGVTSPSNLTIDTKGTPFNIGEGIELQGFQLDEVQSLVDGLRGKVSNPQAVMKEILDWTGGQPFLTQKLCKLIVKEVEKGNFHSVRQVVLSRIIENWQEHDNPEHLRPIRDRLLADEKIAGRMLGLYEEILRNGSISADMSEEKVQLRLSGLVAKEDEKLVVYNLIYEKIFERKWIKEKLVNLRPNEYASAFNAWVAGGQDDSLLLRGENMEAALRWKEGRSLSAQDQDFIVRSQELDRQDKQKANQILEEARKKADLALEEEKQAVQRLTQTQQRTELTLKEEKRAKQTLAETQKKTESALKEEKRANQKANRRIRIGSAFLVFAAVAAAVAVASLIWTDQKLTVANKQLGTTEAKAEQATQKANKEEDRANKATQEATEAKTETESAKKELTQTKVRSQEIEKQLESSQSNLKKTNQQLANTEQQKQQAEVERQRANEERNQAFRETTQARQSRDVAVKQAEQAKIETEQAEQQTRIAQAELRDTESAKKKAEEGLQIAQEVTRLEKDGASILRRIRTNQVNSEPQKIEILLTAIRLSQELREFFNEKSWADRLSPPLHSMHCRLFSTRSMRKIGCVLIPFFYGRILAPMVSTLPQVTQATPLFCGNRTGIILDLGKVQKAQNHWKV